MRVSITLRLAGTVLLFCAVASAVEPGPPPSIAPDFSALDDKTASATADNIVADSLRMERQLISQLDAPTTPANRKVLLIYVLGQLRSRSAVASLVKIMDFKAPFVDPKSDIGRWGPYPVVDALTSIGSDAVYRVIDVLPTETNTLRVRLFATVIYGVEGAVPGRTRLTMALADARDDTAKRNLQNALSVYDGLVKQFGQ